MAWYWRAYSSRFSLCFIVNLGRWILFFCLIFSLFKSLLIILVMQGASTRDFNIFDVDKVFFFTSWTILLLNCGDNFSGLPVGFLVPYFFGHFKLLLIMVLLHPKVLKISLWDFPTLFRAVISPFSNSDNLIPLAIYVFSSLSLTVEIAFILRRLYIINFSIKLSPFFFSFY